jgi:hypothetical protein
VICLKEYKVICPLLNFHIPLILKGHPEYTREEVTEFFEKLRKLLVEGIELADGVIVRRISKEDVEDINRYRSLLPTNMDLSSARFVLAKNVAGEDHEFRMTNVMHRIVLGLRLFKEGYVSGNFVFYVSLSEESRIVDWSRDEGQRREMLGQGYVLDFEEIPNLQNLLEKLERIDFDGEKRLSLACKRFGRAYEEDDFEDQLIDLMIALEALFVRKDVEGVSAKRKIASECSALLGKDDKEKEFIRGRLLEAYSTRNCIVHGSEYGRAVAGNQIEEDFDFMKDLVQDVEGFVRDSIGSIIRQKDQ